MLGSPSARLNKALPILQELVGSLDTLTLATQQENNRAALMDILSDSSILSSDVIQKQLLDLTTHCKVVVLIQQQLNELVSALARSQKQGIDQTIDSRIRELQPAIYHILCESRDKQYNHILHQVAQLLTYLAPRNEHTDRGVLRHDNNEPINLTRAYFSATGYVFSYEQTKDHEAFLTELINAGNSKLAATERRAVASHLTAEGKKDRSQLLEYGGRYLIQSALFNLIYLVYSWEVGRCLDAPGEFHQSVSRPDNFLFNTASFACSSIGMASETYGDSCECYVSSASSTTVIMQGFFFVMMFAGIYRAVSNQYQTHYSSVRERIADRLTGQSDRDISLKRVITDTESIRDNEADRAEIRRLEKKYQEYVDSFVVANISVRFADKLR